MTRFPLLIGLSLLVAGLGVTSRHTSVAVEAAAQKQSCKTVAKKVHGKVKKVKVCHTPFVAHSVGLR